MYHAKKHTIVDQNKSGKKVHFNGELIAGTVTYLENKVVHGSVFARDIMAYTNKKEYNVA